MSRNEERALSIIVGTVTVGVLIVTAIAAIGLL
jgi:hypothetical protein